MPINYSVTRRERLKSAPYLRLKNRKTFFLEKLVIFEKKFSFKKSRIVPKNVNGGTLLDLNIHAVAQYQKTRRGDPFETLKIFSKKVAQCRKNPKGGPLGTSGFVGFLEKVKK